MASTGENLDKLNNALAQVAIKNHANGTKNPYAQYQRKISLEQVLNARKAANKPLGLYDFAPISDGATALILTSEAVAKEMGATPVYVLGAASATDYLDYSARDRLDTFHRSTNRHKKSPAKQPSQTLGHACS